MSDNECYKEVDEISTNPIRYLSSQIIQTEDQVEELEEEEYDEIRYPVYSTKAPTLLNEFLSHTHDILVVQLMCAGKILEHIINTIQSLDVSYLWSQSDVRSTSSFSLSTSGLIPNKSTNSNIDNVFDDLNHSLYFGFIDNEENPKPCVYIRCYSSFTYDGETFDNDDYNSLMISYENENDERHNICKNSEVLNLLYNYNLTQIIQEENSMICFPMPITSMEECIKASNIINNKPTFFVNNEDDDFEWEIRVCPSYEPEKELHLKLYQLYDNAERFCLSDSDDDALFLQKTILLGEIRLIIPDYISIP